MGWSIWKLVILGAVVYYVWNWFRRQQIQAQRPPGPAPGAASAAATEPRRPKAVDLVKCPKCDAYVTQGSGRGCNRPDCPTL